MTPFKVTEEDVSVIVNEWPKEWWTPVEGLDEVIPPSTAHQEPVIDPSLNEEEEEEENDDEEDGGGGDEDIDQETREKDAQQQVVT